MAYSLPDEKYIEVLQAYADADENQSEAARRLGRNRKTFVGQLMRARHLVESGVLEWPPASAAEPILPDFPVDDIPIEDVIDQMCRRFETRHASHKAHTWFPIKFPENKPIGLMWWGDPHLDDNGCNWPLIKRYAEICKNTDGLWSVNIGDTTNNWVGRLVRLYADQDTSLKTARRLAQWFMADAGIKWLVWLLGNHDCVTEDTELLTQRGWIDHSDIRHDDMVLGINTDTGRAEWQPVQAVVRKSSPEIWRLEGPRIDLACTARHRVLTSERNGKYKFRNPPELPRHFQLPVARSVGAPDYDIPDEHLRFAAWVLTDGTITPRGDVSIYQSKRANIDHIAAVLDDCGIRYSMYVRNRDVAEICGTAVKSTRPQHQFAVLAESRPLALSIVPQKGKLPFWVQHLSDRQFAIFLDEYIRGDGSWYPAPRNGAIIYGEKPILDEMQAACLMHGISANVSQDNRGAWRLNVCYKQNAQTPATGAKWSIKRYTGLVWCLKVPHGNFMVRRNGKAHFTGNSWNDGAEILAMMGKVAPRDIIVHEWESRFRLEFPNGREVKVHAAHNFKGHSLWHNMHGLVRQANLGEDTDLLVSGHLHTWGIHREELAGKGGTFPTMIRVRGFKHMDDHARDLGFSDEEEGGAIMTIIDPNAESRSGLVNVFTDIPQGVKVLKALRVAPHE